VRGGAPDGALAHSEWDGGAIACIGQSKNARGVMLHWYSVSFGVVRFNTASGVTKLCEVGHGDYRV
jgi:hypothetical protein